jgi:hypothetical protein
VYTSGYKIVVSSGRGRSPRPAVILLPCEPVDYRVASCNDENDPEEQAQLPFPDTAIDE